MDFNQNMSEVELDRPGYLPTTADCVKWAADGRLAVNLGTTVMIYEPRFEGGEAYRFAAYTVPCPDHDKVLLDLQRFPGQAGDAVEFARKGLKYLTATDPGLEKAIVGGDATTVKTISWSPLGCAWDGGCLLSVSTSLHTVAVYQPPRAGPEGWNWEPLVSVSSALLDWGLKVCPTPGAKKYRACITPEEPELAAATTDGGGGGSVEEDFGLSGLWAVARGARTRAVAWMGRTVRRRNNCSNNPNIGSSERKDDSNVPHASTDAADGVASGNEAGGGAERETGGDKDDGGGGTAREGSCGDEDEFTLLALAGEHFVSLWAFSSGAAAQAPSGSGADMDVDANQEGLSLELVEERPAWAGDLRAMGGLREDGEEVRAIAWCHESCRGSTSTPTSTPTSSSGVSDYLALGTSTGAVLLLRLVVDVPEGGEGGFFGGRGAVPKVEVLPFRRVCYSDERPVSFMTFVFPGGQSGTEEGLSTQQQQPALAVAKGLMVTLFPLVTADRDDSTDSGDSINPKGNKKHAASRGTPSSTGTSSSCWPAAAAPPGIEWEAHEHNVTGISTAPFPGPLCSAASFNENLSTSGWDHDDDIDGGVAPPPEPSSGKDGGKTGRGGRGFQQDRRQGERREKRTRSGDVGGGGDGSALVYTCSMDGLWKEWKVAFGGGGGGGGGGAVSLRKSMSGDSRRPSAIPRPSPPVLGCAASPNGVLVACMAFCPPETSARKAVEHVRRKGKHCRVIVSPMVPAAAERATAAPGGHGDDGGAAEKDEDLAWKFSLAADSLATDWAWYLRAATLAGVKVQSARDGVVPFSLIPSLRKRLETAISLAAETLPQRSPTIPATDYDKLSALLRLHHLVLTSVAGVAEYRTSIPSVPEVRPLGDEDPLDEDIDVDTSTPEIGTRGVRSMSIGSSVSSYNGCDPHSQGGGVPRREVIAAQALATASAARTRLVLMKAWRDVSEAGTAGAGAAAAAEQLQRNGSSAAAGGGGGGCRGERTKGAELVRRETAESCLREACRRARLRASTVGGGGDGGGLNCTRGSTGGEGFLAGPLATPFVDLPRIEDVEKVVLAGREAVAGESGALSRSEKCLLCGAEMMDEDGGGQREGNDKASSSAMGRVQDLPGWAVCCRGHRLRRCMETLTPSLAIGYKRCEVCRCILEVASSSSPADGVDGADKGPVPAARRGRVSSRGRTACVFCDVLLVTAAGMVS